MKFGYFTLSDNNYRGSPRSPVECIRQNFEQCLHAEDVGMNSVWLGERHFDRTGALGSPSIVLSAVAGKTSRVRLGSAVCSLPLNHPIRVAEAWATLDLLSNGRVDFGIGRGVDPYEFERFQADYERNAQIFDESYEIIQRAWQEPGRWSYDGQFFHIKDVEVVPRPVQDPIPVFLAASSHRSLENVAKSGFNLMLAVFGSQRFGGLRPAMEQYRSYCDVHGTQPKRAVASWFVHVATTPQERLYGREALIKYFRECMIDPGVAPVSKENSPADRAHTVDFMEYLASLTPDDIDERQALIGSPEEMIEKLKVMEAAGIDEMLLYFNFGLKPHEMVKDQMSQFMEEVAVHFDGGIQLANSSSSGIVEGKDGQVLTSIPGA